jgi:hypothetical protein
MSTSDFIAEIVPRGSGPRYQASARVWAATADQVNDSTAAELAQIYASASLFQEAPRGFTNITSGACSIDPTSRASWPLKASTSAPGWAARSVTSDK